MNNLLQMICLHYSLSKWFFLSHSGKEIYLKIIVQFPKLIGVLLERHMQVQKPEALFQSDMILCH